MCVKKKNGFTLVEIMIVVAIVGLLASFITVSVRKSLNNAKTKTAEAELNMFSTAILQMAWDTGRWPNGRLRTRTGGGIIEDISCSDSSLMVADTNNIYFGWKGPYYEGSKADPWGNPYFFNPDHADGVVVGSSGPDGDPNSGDDVTVSLND